MRMEPAFSCSALYSTATRGSADRAAQRRCVIARNTGHSSLASQAGVVPVDPVAQHARVDVAVQDRQQHEAQRRQAGHRQPLRRQRPIAAAPQSASASWKNGMKRTSMMPSAGPAAVSAAPTSAA